MRIDKFLSNLGFISRKDAKKIFKQKKIFLNGEIIEKPETKIIFGDEIVFFEQKVIYKENIFVILNKKQNFVSSKVNEANYESVYELLDNCNYKNILEIVGRLDIDTTGLLLFTNNGQIIHKLINPKKDIFKKYYVKVKNNLSEKNLEKLKKGVIIDGSYRTKEAKVEKISENEIFLSIQEGKFHQIKKMLLAIENEITKLHRTEIGEIKIGDLELGKWRFLEQNEIDYLENL